MKQRFIRPRPRSIPGQMNKLEQSYADFLSLLKKGGDIIDFRYEAIKFRLAERTFYTPDFLVTYPDKMECHEVKGFMEEDANVKLKVVAEMFHEFKFVLVKKEKKSWIFKEI